MKQPHTDPESRHDRLALPSRLALRLHYGWIVVVLGVLVVMCALGIGRFAFGMLLPSMGEGLALSYREMGVISTSNFIGYLLGALVSGRLTVGIGARRLITAALATISVSLMIISISSGFWLILVLFTVTGLGSGSANVAIMGLISHWFQRSLRGRASGLVVTGSGYAIMLTGLIIPLINSSYGVNGWRVGWFVLALLVILIAVAAALLLRNHPKDVGLAAAGHPVKDAHPHSPVLASEQRRATWHLGSIYFAFGFSYVIYVTFIVTTLVQQRGFRESTAGWFWFAFGFFSIFSGPIFGALSRPHQPAHWVRSSLCPAQRGLRSGEHAPARALSLPLGDPLRPVRLEHPRDHGGRRRGLHGSPAGRTHSWDPHRLLRGRPGGRPRRRRGPSRLERHVRLQLPSSGCRRHPGSGPLAHAAPPEQRSFRGLTTRATGGGCFGGGRLLCRGLHVDGGLLRLWLLLDCFRLEQQPHRSQRGNGDKCRRRIPV